MVTFAIPSICREVINAHPNVREVDVQYRGKTYIIEGSNGIFLVKALPEVSMISCTLEELFV